MGSAHSIKFNIFVTTLNIFDFFSILHCIENYARSEDEALKSRMPFQKFVFVREDARCSSTSNNQISSFAEYLSKLMPSVKFLS